MAYVPIDIRFKLITLQDLIYATFTVNGSTAGGVWIDTRCAHHLERAKTARPRFSFAEMQLAVVTARYRL